MILRSMTADFGVLQNRSIAFEDGLNIITAPNESGKSTWCAFLCTMLYGLDTSAREKQGEKPDRVKYAPWSKAAMSGSMDIEYEGAFITVRRWTEKANAPMQAFSATYTGTEEPVPGLTGDNLGETLTGMPRAVFERSAFIRQGGMAVSNSAEMEKHIHALLSGGEEGLSYTETEKRLALWQRHRKPGAHGAREDLENAAAGNEDSLRRIRQNGEQIAALDAQLETLRDERTEALRRMEEARARQRRHALEEMAAGRRRAQAAEQKAEEAKAALDAQVGALNKTPFGGAEPGEAAAQVRDLKRRAEGLEKLAKRTPPLWISYIFLALFAAAVGLSFVMTGYRTELIAAGAIALVLFALFFGRLLDMRKNARGILEDRQMLLEKAGVREEAELDPLLEKYTVLWEKKQQTQRQYETLRNQYALERERQKTADAVLIEGLDFSRGDSEAALAGRELERLDAAIEELREQRARLEGKSAMLGDPLVIGSELSEQRTRLDALDEEYEAIGLALQTLSEADGTMQSRFSPALSRRAAEYFSELTGGRYDEITLARDLSAKARLSGEVVGHEAAYLSEGTADQLYLAVRLAVCELAMPEGKSCPAVLDDALVNFDGERLNRALSRIAELARTRQVLLFSCHDRERMFFATDPAVNKISAGL